MQDLTPATQANKIKSQNDTLWFFLILFIIISIIEGVFILNSLGDNNNEKVSETIETATDNTRLSLAYTPTPSLTTAPALKVQTQALNNEYLFPLKDYEGNEVTQVRYLLKQYEFTKEVSVNFQKATITNDKIVLVFDIEITNDSNSAFEIIARDYLRLSVNGTDKWLAPDMHTDPVEVRPHSTKETKVGFTINETDSNIKLQVGELEGEKDIIEIN